MPRTSREHLPTEDRLRELLVGRRVVDTELHSEPYDSYGYVTLDDGTRLKLAGNEGCGGCSSGWYELSKLLHQPSVITNVTTTADPKDDDSPFTDDGSYKIFVVTATPTGDSDPTLLAEFTGTDGNGWYGTGWWLEVVR